MSKERIMKTLKGLGLSDIDTHVYVYLAKQGSTELNEIAVALNMPDRKVDKSLKDLQNKRIVKASIEQPLEYMAVPFEEVIDLFIKAKKEQARAIQQAKKELLSSWRKMTKDSPEKS